MKPAHARIVNSFAPDTVRYLLAYFRCSKGRRRLPSEHLAAAGIGQADVVLALVRGNDQPLREAAERLIGHRILRCPPCLRPRAPLEIPDRVSPDQRRITRIICNGRQPNTGAHYRFAIMRPGMSVEQFLVRGGTRRDLRIALRRGLVEISP